MTSYFKSTPHPNVPPEFYNLTDLLIGDLECAREVAQGIMKAQLNIEGQKYGGVGLSPRGVDAGAGVGGGQEDALGAIFFDNRRCSGRARPTRDPARQSARFISTKTTR